jgi:hypothetical protein
LGLTWVFTEPLCPSIIMLWERVWNVPVADMWTMLWDSDSWVQSLWESGLQSDTLACRWCIFSLHSFLLWHRSSCSLRRGEHMWSPDSFLFLKESHIFNYLLPSYCSNYYSNFEIIFIWRSLFNQEQTRPHTLLIDTLKTYAYYDKYPHGKNVFSGKPKAKQMMKPDSNLDHLSPFPRPPSFRLIDPLVCRKGSSQHLYLLPVYLSLV